MGRVLELPKPGSEFYLWRCRKTSEEVSDVQRNISRVLGIKTRAGKGHSQQLDIQNGFLGTGKSDNLAGA